MLIYALSAWANDLLVGGYSLLQLYHKKMCVFLARFWPQVSVFAPVFEICNQKATPNVELLCYLFK